MVTVNTSLPPASPGVQPSQDFSQWLDPLIATRSESEAEVISRAFQVAQDAHKNQLRASGEPYLSHVATAARILSDLNLDHETVAAALLHDVVEDTPVSLEDLREEFGESIARLVDGVTKMSKISQYPAPSDNTRKEQVHAESLRKMLLAMADDMRVVLIKLADRLHNMRTLGHLAEHKRIRIAKETLEIYAPLANRLGIWQIKWELEDLAFRHLEPDNYKQIAKLLDERRVDREEYINRVIDIIKDALEHLHIKAEVTGRPKHIYSISRKMKRKSVPFHEIFDTRAVRILVNDVATCYSVLGIVHTLWQHVPKEFDDYIATPKGNNYQSLHTAVVGPQRKVLEVQIRSHEMHQHAELGVAAHWRYKEGVHKDQTFEDKISWLRQILEWRDEETDADDFIHRFKTEIFQDRVYVVTPKGTIIDLPQGATPLDFAYYVHTDVGHRCRGAKVNGKIVTLNYELKSGDQVEVLTTRSSHPSMDWLSPHLGYLKTPRARAKARQWFKHQDYEKNTAAGRAIVDKELNRLSIHNLAHDTLAKRLNFNQTNDFYAAVGSSDISSAQIAGAAQDLAAPPQVDKPLLPIRKAAKRPAPGGANNEVRVLGVGNLLTYMARCCKPVPQESIVGFITKSHGVTIHRSDCQNVLRLNGEKRERLIEVEWAASPQRTYPVDVELLAFDRRGLLRDITTILANDRVNILAMQTATNQNYTVKTTLTLEISDLSQLSKLLDRLAQLPNVMDVNRRL